MAVATATIGAIAQIAIAAAAVASTAYSIASAPSVPEVPKPPAPPPPPPGVPPPPKKAPTVADADAGVAAQRKERQRAFGLEQTILAGPKLGNAGTSTTAPGTKLGRRSIL